MVVNVLMPLAHPPVFVARDRGKSLPRFHKARVEGNQG